MNKIFIKIIKAVFFLPFAPFLAWFCYSKQKDLGGEPYPYFQALKDCIEQLMAD